MRVTMIELKDWGQLLAWGAAVAGAIYAVYKGNKELHASTLQRHAELQWKQASTAKELVIEIHRHRLAALAVELMDNEAVSCQCELDSKELVCCNFEDAMAALRKSQKECDPKEVFLRNCFDWFFYYVDQIQHYIDRTLISFDDVGHIFKPYARKLAHHRDTCNAFM